MGFTVEVLEFEHACVRRRAERAGRTVKVSKLRKIRGSGTCDCVVTHASSFVFYSFRNWEPVELL